MNIKEILKKIIRVIVFFAFFTSLYLIMNPSNVMGKKYLNQYLKEAILCLFISIVFLWGKIEEIRSLKKGELNRQDKVDFFFTLVVGIVVLAVAIYGFVIYGMDKVKGPVSMECKGYKFETEGDINDDDWECFLKVDDMKFKVDEKNYNKYKDEKGKIKITYYKATKVLDSIENARKDG